MRTFAMLTGGFTEWWVNLEEIVSIDYKGGGATDARVSTTALSEAGVFDVPVQAIQNFGAFLSRYPNGDVARLIHFPSAKVVNLSKVAVLRVTPTDPPGPWRPSYRVVMTTSPHGDLDLDSEEGQILLSHLHTPPTAQY